VGENSFNFFSINHHERIIPGEDGGDYDDEAGDDSDVTTKARVRLDATLDLRTGQLNYAQEEEEEVEDRSNWFQAYVPEEEDGCYLENPDGTVCDSKTVCWWHMADGKVLGLHEKQLVEYDAETLSPLGVVVTKEQLAGSNGEKEVLVVQNKSILVLVDDKTRDMEVVHPNADGSYWRKFQRNKKVRLEEKAREEVARRWLDQNIAVKKTEDTDNE